MVSDATGDQRNAAFYANNVGSNFGIGTIGGVQAIRSNYGTTTDGQVGIDSGLVARHLDTINVSFSDGHVKAMRRDALMVKNPAGVLSMFTIADDDNCTTTACP